MGRKDLWEGKRPAETGPVSLFPPTALLDAEIHQVCLPFECVRLEALAPIGRYTRRHFLLPPHDKTAREFSLPERPSPSPPPRWADLSLTTTARSAVIAEATRGTRKFDAVAAALSAPKSRSSVGKASPRGGTRCFCSTDQPWVRGSCGIKKVRV